MSLLAATSRASIAGAIGTLAMDLVWYSRYRRGGGSDGFPTWEFTGGLESWDDAPAPAQVARKLVKRVLARDIPVERAGLANNVMHWGYGVGWATLLGLLARRVPTPVWRGPAFGALVWGSDYVTLPLLDIYEPIWTYDRKTLSQDLSAHLVYGTTTDTVLRVLGTGR
jgi:hypothetical protein